MTPNDAQTIADLMRRQHGGYAETFVAKQIAHFTREITGVAALAAWRAVQDAMKNPPAARAANKSSGRAA